MAPHIVLFLVCNVYEKELHDYFYFTMILLHNPQQGGS